MQTSLSLLRHARWMALAGGLALATLLPALAPAQDFPSHVVTIVVPFPPGGGADTLARILAKPLATAWKQTVLIDNRPGASGHIGAGFVARSAPDGHTLVMASTAALDKANVAEFAPIALVSASPYVAVVRPGLGVHNVREFVAKAKAEPGKLTFGSSGEGSASHLTVELFKQVAGVNMMHVPYKGTGQALTDLLGGNIDFMFAPAETVMPHVRSGKLVALGVTSSVRARALPELPTIAESGVPGYSAVGWFGLLAPSGTPAPVVARLSSDIEAALKSPEVVKAILSAGAEPSQGTPEDFGRFIHEEIAKWGQLQEQIARSRAH